MKNGPRVIFCGGGTGGHIYPALAVAELLRMKNQQVDILFIGTKNGLETKIVPQHGFKIQFIEVKGLRRKISIENLSVFAKFLKGYRMAKRIVSHFSPNVVVVTGGYVSLPVAIAAKRLRKKIIVHEQNAYPGLANRIISNFCDKVLISFDESIRFFKRKEKVITTGNPIRLDILKYNKNAAKNSLGLSDRFVILSTGGSKGAENLSKAVIKLSKELVHETKIYFILSTGDKKYYDALNFANEIGAKGNIDIVPYINDMPRYLAAADIVISRAGAVAISEITAIGKPSIIVPSPYVTNNHQEYNARVLEKNQACFVVLEDQLESNKLKEYIIELYTNQNLYEQMSKNSKSMGRIDATEKIANIILEHI